MNEITVGNKISEGRQAKKLSQAQMAEMLCISKQAVGKWERGESMPDILMLARIAQILDVEPNHFFFDNNAIDADNYNSNSYSLDAVNADQGAQSPIEQNQRMIKGRNMSCMLLRDSDFSGLSNLNNKFNSANVQGCKFVGANLKGIVFKANHIKNNDFTGANMENCKFISESVSGNSFTNVILRSLVQKSCSIVKNNFTGADFSNASIVSSTFKGNNFDGAIFDSVEFRNCNLSKTKFTSNITNCSFINCHLRHTEFVGITLKNVFFKGSYKGASFVDCYADNITYAFLKSAKADVSGIKIVE